MTEYIVKRIDGGIMMMEIEVEVHICLIFFLLG